MEGLGVVMCFNLVIYIALSGIKCLIHTIYNEKSNLFVTETGVGAMGTKYGVLRVCR